MARGLKLSRDQLRAICRDDQQAIRQLERLFSVVDSLETGGGGAVADGDYVDITVSDDGATWTINPSGATPGSYTNASVTVGLDGRITAVSSGTGGGIDELTGDVTAGPGSGSQVATIANSAVTTTKINNGAVTNAKMDTMAATSIKGRQSFGAGAPQDIAVGASLEIAGLGLVRAALTGDVTATVNSNTTTIAAGVVSNTKLADVTGPTFKGRVTGTGSPADLTSAEATSILDAFTSALKGLAPASGGGTTNFLRADGTWAAPPDTTGIDQLTGDVTAGPGSGSQAATIAANAVTDTKLRDSAALSVIGRSANSTGDPADIAAGTDGHVLRRSGTTLGFGTVVAAGLASNAVTTVKISNDQVTNAKLANVATATFKGRTTAGTGDPEDLTATQATALLNTVTSALKGLAPASGGGTLNYLRADGTWTKPAQGSSVTSDTDIVSVGAITLDEVLEVGRYRVDLCVFCDIVGGSSGDGLVINNANSGGLTFSATNYIIWGIEGSAASSFFASATSGSFAATGVASSMIRIDGVLDVTVAGTLAFDLAVNGAPTSVTIKAGSFLTTTRIG